MRYLYVGATSELDTDADREALAAVRARVSEEFGAPVRDLRLPGMDFAFDPHRRQFASIPVLEMLLRECPSDALKLLAVTGRDLYIPVLTFVYGQAQLGGRVAVMSLARLRQEFYGLATDREVFLHRASKEAMHETGHMFGLVHCTDRSCAMSLSTNIRQVDGKRAAFCASCAGYFLRHSKGAIS